MKRNKRYLFLLMVLLATFLIVTPVFAHRSGCHRWHSCPSDSGSYTCGDAGHPCLYPTYPASGGVIYPPSGYYKDCYDCPLKKVPSNAYASTLGIGLSCNIGYKKVGDTCEKIVASINCPLNSHISLSDSTKCECDAGFQANVARNACVVVSITTDDQICKNVYGLNSSWSGTKTSSGLLVCGCQSGYTWNSTRTACDFNFIIYQQTYTQSQQNDETIGINYYKNNHTCVGVSDNQYVACISYAYNH